MIKFNNVLPLYITIMYETVEWWGFDTQRRMYESSLTVGHMPLHCIHVMFLSDKFAFPVTTDQMQHKFPTQTWNNTWALEFGREWLCNPYIIVIMFLCYQETSAIVSFYYQKPGPPRYALSTILMFRLPNLLSNVRKQTLVSYLEDISSIQMWKFNVKFISYLM